MRVELLGAGVDAVDLAGAVEIIGAWVDAGKPCQVITLNPEILYRAQNDPGLLDLINRAGLVTADGVGIVWGCRVAGQPLPGRVAGIDLLEGLARLSARKGWPVFLLGGAKGVAEEAAARLAVAHPGLKVAGTHHGFFGPDGEEAVVREVARSGAVLLFVGMGAPRQEKFIAGHLPDLPVAMGVGGSLDVLAGRVKRVGILWRRLRLEWLGRLVREPSRWRRALVLPRYVGAVLTRYRLLRRR
ncbi:MAG: WecB/TagA/CpsF family glycosyltransferase [Peptococcaceae bacterium]|jgi:N-acetylglucosaminyldiphosphoundecaprenol N-acetyl-beta-D-mannosaminyltransferase|nr:WecB/TagA/CpsF family glycosyltransferase [Peptococcaceae bacterium]